MFIRHPVIKLNVRPADQANLHVCPRLRDGFSREHGWVPRGSQITFGVVESSIALRGMIALRKMGQYREENRPMPLQLRSLCNRFKQPLETYRYSRSLGHAF